MYLCFVGCCCVLLDVDGCSCIDAQLGIVVVCWLELSNVGSKCTVGYSCIFFVAGFFV